MAEWVDKDERFNLDACTACGVRYVEHAGLHGTCKALQAVTAERDRLRAALLVIAEQFPPGEERRTYGDLTKTLDRIRETARGAIYPAP